MAWADLIWEGAVQDTWYELQAGKIKQGYSTSKAVAIPTPKESDRTGISWENYC